MHLIGQNAPTPHMLKSAPFSWFPFIIDDTYKVELINDNQLSTPTGEQTLQSQHTHQGRPSHRYLSFSGTAYPSIEAYEFQGGPPRTLFQVKEMPTIGGYPIGLLHVGSHIVFEHHAMAQLG
jgi:hypothetical protein